MVENSHANKIAPKGIHPRAFSLAKKDAHGLLIQPMTMKTAAHMATVA